MWLFWACYSKLGQHKNNKLLWPFSEWDINVPNQANLIPVYSHLGDGLAFIITMSLTTNFICSWPSVLHSHWESTALQVTHGKYHMMLLQKYVSNFWVDQDVTSWLTVQWFNCILSGILLDLSILLTLGDLSKRCQKSYHRDNWLVAAKRS